MNLLMLAPLLDSRGNVRYFIGAQVDVSGLVKESSDLEAFQRMIDQQEGFEDEDEAKSDFQQLSEMFDHTELNAVRKYGGHMHREHFENNHETNGYGGGSGSRVLIQDQSTIEVPKPEKMAYKPDGRLSGPYKHVSDKLQSSAFDQTADPFQSTSSFGPHLPYAFFSPRPLYEFQASYNLRSLIALVATIKFENLLPVLCQMAAVA